MSLIGLPTLDLNFLRAEKIFFDTAGDGIGGGRNIFQQESSFDLSGGGYVVATYGPCWVQTPEQHNYVTWLSARLKGGYRFINVPLRTDWQGPFPISDRVPQPRIGGVTHSDGSTFSDGAGYSQARVWGKFVDAAALGAGVIRMRIYNASRLLLAERSDWFGVYHPGGKGWRAYRYWEIVKRHVDGVEDGNPYQEYSLAIGPALREAVAAGRRIEFYRPRFAAKIRTGTRIVSDIEGFWLMRPTLEFEEVP